MTAKKAIDVSYVQKNVDYKAVKASGISAVIARNGYLGKTDTEFDKHVSGALAAGLSVGTYTYMISRTPEQARREAAETVSRIEKYKGRLTFPIFADIEDDRYMTSLFNKNSRTELLLAFLDEISRAGYYPAVYINPSWLEAYVDKTKIQGRYDIWLAAWTKNPKKPTRFDYGQTMWQWGLDNVKGVGEVDGDLVYVDYPERIRAAGKNYLPKYVPVELAFDAAIRAQPTPSSKKLGLLTAGSKCVIVKGSDTFDKASNYTYVQLAGKGSQWIVKSAIKVEIK